MNEKQNRKSVFLNRNFNLVFFGALVSEIGALFYSFAVSFYILEISENNAFLQGLYLAVCGVFTLIFTPVGGVLGDRFNKAKIMFICDFIKGGIIILATVIMTLFRDPSVHIALLFAIGIVGNAVSGIFNPASGALLPHIVEKESLQQANSYFAMKNALEGIVGVVLAGFLYSVLPIQILFFIVGGSYIASGISEMFIRYEHCQPDGSLTIKVAFRDMRDGMTYLKSQKPMLALLVSALFINFFFTPVTSNFIPFFIETDLAASTSYLFDDLLTPEMWLSVFQVCIGISSLVAAAILSGVAQKEKCGRKVAVLIGLLAVVMILLSACYGLFVVKTGDVNMFLISAAIGSLLIGYLVSNINIPITTAVMRTVDEDKHSKVNSIINIGSQGMIPIASVLAGIILENSGSLYLLIFCAAGFAITSIFLLFNKDIKDI